jgi:O-antigen/teichoic acid export membrane protein
MKPNFIPLLFRAKRLLLVFRLRPFDTATVGGRSQERYRRVAVTTVSAIAAKSIGALTSLVSVPLTLSYLGPERYGLWMAVGSVVAILTFSDFGIGNGLVNAVSEANGKSDRELARRYISSAFFMLTSVSVLLSIVFGLGYRWIPWHRLFNVHSAVATAEAGPAMAVFFACFVVNIPLGVVNRIQVGYQQGFSNNLWGAVGNVFALCAVILACRRRAGLPWLVLAMAGAPTVATLLNGAVLLGKQRPWLFPSWRYCDLGASRVIFRIGMMFFVLQGAVAVAFSSDNIVLAQVLGPAAVTEYAVPAKMFGVIGMLIATVWAPLWPAYGEALARREFSWVRKTLKRAILLALGMSVPAYAFLVLFATRLLHLWVGNEVAPPFLLLVGFGLWGILTALGNSLAMFLNAAGVIRSQVILSTLMAVVNLALSIFLTHRLGASGPVWGSVISYTALIMLPLVILLPRLVRSLCAEKEYVAAQP